MFDTHIYVNRRKRLNDIMIGEYNCGGIAVFLGNIESPQNYRGNDYKFRQESSFLYYWGLDEPGLAAILDLDNHEEYLFGNDVDIDDIVWMGPQPSMVEKAASIAVAQKNVRKYNEFASFIKATINQGRKVHFLPQSRYYNAMTMSSVLGCSPEQASSRVLDGSGASLELVKAVVSMRIIKEPCEIEEIDKACDIGYIMHSTARKGCKAGVIEQEIVGQMEAAVLSKAWGVSFATILSQNGETLHNHTHHQIITPGRLLVVDAGAESNTHYASDFTRTYPCAGVFTTKQREIYDIVHAANEFAYSKTQPGITYREVHIATVTEMMKGLAALDIVRGDVNEMVAKGVGGLFMPHGLGHNMGIDVHDMEDLGENYVGYDEDQKREGGIGLANLRMARKLRSGHVVTDEPGIYFIPALIAQFKREGNDFLSAEAMRSFVNFEKLEKEYLDFGGIRLEDDILITETGSRRLGSKRLPIASKDIEDIMAKE